ncbi:MAG: ATP-binding protein [bacterium]|nr:ATP-binding protein [bacterium]
MLLIEWQVRMAVAVFVIVFAIWLQFLISRFSKQRYIKTLFLILVLSLLGWLIPVSIVLTPRMGSIVFFPRFSLASSVFINFSALLITYFLVNKKPLAKVYFRALLVASFGLSGLALSSAIFKSSLIINGVVTVVTGWGMAVFAVYVIVSAIATIIILIRGVRRLTGLDRRNIMLILIGMCGMLAGFIFTVMIPIMIAGNATMVKFGGLYILFFLICSAVAIIRYNFFDVKMIAAETVIVFLNCLLLSQIFLSQSLVDVVLRIVFLILSVSISLIFWKQIRRDRKQYEDLINLTVLEKNNRQLQLLDKQKTEFLNIAAHQLRTPVSVIKNYIAMLGDGDFGSVSRDVGEVHGHIGQSAEWLVRLSDEFLNIANLEQNRTKYRLADCDLGLVIDSVVNELQRHAANKGLKIGWQRPASVGLHAHFDEEKIRNAIFNYVDNAIKYSVQGEIKILATVEDGIVNLVGDAEAGAQASEALKKASGVAVRVIDSGMGFGTEDADKLFQKFQRGAKAHTVEVNSSTGIGLYIARMFVEGHNGKVWATSAGEEKGSEFGLWIPFANSNK